MKRSSFMLGILLCSVMTAMLGITTGCGGDGDVPHRTAFNVFASSGREGVEEVNAGAGYWIRMSTGYESDNGEAEARADLPNIELRVSMDGVDVPMDGGTVVEQNSGANSWEINSYHYTGALAAGDHTVIGTSYKNSVYVDSASFILRAE
jgi:hypothetical protein